jgi:transcription-repair coupling factor (superfamily II helicase)
VLPATPGAYLAFVVARLAARAEVATPVLVVTTSDERAAELCCDIEFFLGRHAGEGAEAWSLPEAMLLPAVETTPYAEISADRTPVMQRLALLSRLNAARGGSVFVCSAAALRRRVLPRATLDALSLRVEVDQDVGRERLIEALVASGHERTPVVDDPGSFSVRGGIVDVFPPLSRFPARIELFDDLVESIRLFDPGSQRTLRSVQAVELHPVRETVRSPDVDPRERILALGDELSHPTRKTRQLLDEIATGRDFFGVEALTPAFHSQLEPLWSYLDALHTPGPDPGPGVTSRSGVDRQVAAQPLWIVEQPEAVADALREQDARARAGYESRLADGRLAFPPAAFFLEAESIIAQLARRPRLEVGSSLDGAASALSAIEAEVIRVEVQDNADVVAELKRARAERGEVILRGLAERLSGWVSEGLPVVVAAGSAAHAERLEALLGEHMAALDVRAQLALASHEDGAALLAPTLDAVGAASAGVRLQAGGLSGGFRLPGQLVLLSHDEIFGPKSTRRPSRRRIGAGLGDLAQLAEGDYIVHAEHGVGHYRGLMQLTVDNVSADFMLLEYAGGDRLYLPVHRMSQVAKYVGADGGTPRLDRLGGVTWQKKQKKVATDVRRFSEELLQLYAQRAALEGHAYPDPGAEYLDFAASFPFTETDDQQRAIDEVLEELAGTRPMDRLVCGDVGFGKTEVALRAAFNVALAGHQVAVLAPTTVLVEQHYRTFAERMNPYPLRVEAVSRFRKPTELRPVLADLAAGKVDIVIGTHRLLSQDVSFHRLGLLVIDEEQRFGVKHKEALRRLRTQVDVLTMTATPIPRTLQFSMVGLREISVIATPPADRLAIRTITCRYDDALIAEAMRRELARGGQVFFVHNEVQGIDEWAARIAELVPEARVVVGHGQMDARRLERVMLGFVSGESDVLVCTTIIESGLDIPRANTMFVNRADRFGLSQLYQLRGRIGRSRRRAYCYLLVPGIEGLSDEARKRLEVLQQFSQLGSGFSVASYDLELRGAGDLLGAKQSGHIAAIGFEAYARILEEAVAELKGEPIHRETDPDLKVALSAYIPDDFVDDTGQRLELYKRLSDACTDEGALLEILAELRDRYGPPPEEVDALIEVMGIKGLGIRLGATLVDLGESRLAVRLGEGTPLSAEVLTKLVTDPTRRLRLTPDMRLLRSLDEQERQQPLTAAKKVLRELLAHVNQNRLN